MENITVLSPPRIRRIDPIEEMMRSQFPADRGRRITRAKNELKWEFEVVQQDLVRDAEVFKVLHEVIA